MGAGTHDVLGGKGTAAWAAWNPCHIGGVPSAVAFGARTPHVQGGDGAFTAAKGS